MNRLPLLCPTMIAMLGCQNAPDMRGGGDAGPDRGDAAARDAAPTDGAVIPEGCFAVGRSTMALTVDEAIASGCSTAIVLPLAEQLIEQVNCLVPGAMSRIDDIADLRLGAAATPWLQSPAADGLRAAVEEGGVLSTNSTLRTLPQQFLLYTWYRQDRCSITLAASPGTSPHERGLAIDTSDYTAWRPILERHGYRWHGAGDVVHFDYVGGGEVDLVGQSVLAFQMLWNRNHPEDVIAEDGDYGPQTEMRLRRSPSEGFDVGPDCGEPMPEPMDFSIAWVLDREMYVFSASASDTTENVEYLVDGASLGTAHRADGARFELDAGMCADGAQHEVEAVARDAAGTEIDRGVGMLEGQGGAASYVRPRADATWEVGIERPRAEMVAIEVDVDGTPVTDDVSGEARSTRLAVSHAYSTLGARSFVIRVYDAAGAVIETRSFDFTLR